MRPSYTVCWGHGPTYTFQNWGIQERGSELTARDLRKRLLFFESSGFALQVWRNTHRGAGSWTSFRGQRRQWVRGIQFGLVRGILLQSLTSAFTPQLSIKSGTVSQVGYVRAGKVGQEGPQDVRNTPSHRCASRGYVMFQQQLLLN